MDGLPGTKGEKGGPGAPGPEVSVIFKNKND